MEIGGGRNLKTPPKVALLFLTRGPMPLEAIWRDFLESCPIPWETLFKVHVHLPEGKSYPKKSLFHGRETHERVHVQWGNHSMVCGHVCVCDGVFLEQYLVIYM